MPVSASASASVSVSLALSLPLPLTVISSSLSSSSCSLGNIPPGAFPETPDFDGLSVLLACFRRCTGRHVGTGGCCIWTITATCRRGTELFCTPVLRGCLVHSAGGGRQFGAAARLRLRWPEVHCTCHTAATLCNVSKSPATAIHVKLQLPASYQVPSLNLCVPWVGKVPR